MEQIAATFERKGVSKDMSASYAFRSLNDSLRMADEHHKNHPPSIQRNPVLDMPGVPENIKKTIEDGQKTMLASLISAHRSGLMGFFTIFGVQSDTAAQLVDEVLNSNSKMTFTDIARLIKS
jgi:hypothetical protein